MTQQEVDGPMALRTADEPASFQDTRVVREMKPIEPAGGQAGSGDVLRSSTAIRAERRATLLEKYGGMYWGADFIGFAVAMFFAILFLGIVGGIVGAVGYQLHAPVPKIGHAVTGASVNLGIGALVGSLIALFLAYLMGGYTAGRMARFSGARQGIGVVIWTLVAAVVLGIAGAVAGSQFNVANQLHLNVDATTLTIGGLVSLLIALVVMLVSATVGGLFGERYHRAIDRDVGVIR